MSFNTSDTIVALATAPGKAAIAVLRISGNAAFTIIEKLFVGRNNKPKNFSKVQTHTVHLGILQSNGQIIDEVLIALFKGPQSYTGQDTVEISCHGSPYIVTQILKLCIKNGARLAQAGEFTLRAFLNGKLDLSQAEAVADVIASDSQSNHRIAMQQLRGGFSNEIQILRDALIHFASLIELELDFAEEDVSFASREELEQLVLKMQQKILALCQSFDWGNVIKHGIPVVIAGVPNVGKSTLLNALLNEERAIVSEIAGTTRDTIEEVLNIKGVNFRFTDTAGIRETVDAIEALGVQRTYEKINQSAVVLYLFDATQTTSEQIEQQLDALKKKLAATDAVILPVINKMDKLSDDFINLFKQIPDISFISAKQKWHVDALIELLFTKVQMANVNFDSTIIINARHKEALENTNSALQKVLDGIAAKTTGDFLSSDIRQALYHLGLISGKVATDDLLQNIFSRFCIGK